MCGAGAPVCGVAGEEEEEEEPEEQGLGELLTSFLEEIAGSGVPRRPASPAELGELRRFFPAVVEAFFDTQPLEVGVPADPAARWRWAAMLRGAGGRFEVREHGADCLRIQRVHFASLRLTTRGCLGAGSGAVAAGAAGGDGFGARAVATGGRPALSRHAL